MPDGKSPKARGIALAGAGVALAIAGVGGEVGRNPSPERNPPSRDGNLSRRRDLLLLTAAPRRNEARERIAPSAGIDPNAWTGRSEEIDRHAWIVPSEEIDRHAWTGRSEEIDRHAWSGRRVENARSESIAPSDSSVAIVLGVGRRPSDRPAPVAVPSVLGGPCLLPGKAGGRRARTAGGRRARTAGGRRSRTEIGLLKVRVRSPVQVAAAKPRWVADLEGRAALAGRPRVHPGVVRKAVVATAGRAAPVLNPWLSSATPR